MVKCECLVMWRVHACLQPWGVKYKSYRASGEKNGLSAFSSYMRCSYKRKGGSLMLPTKVLCAKTINQWGFGAVREAVSVLKLSRSCKLTSPLINKVCYIKAWNWQFLFNFALFIFLALFCSTSMCVSEECLVCGHNTCKPGALLWRLRALAWR